MLLGIDYARQAVWRRCQRDLSQARSEGREEGRRKGFRLGFDSRVAEVRRRRNGHNRMFGGADDDR